MSLSESDRRWRGFRRWEEEFLDGDAEAQVDDDDDDAKGRGGEVVEVVWSDEEYHPQPFPATSDNFVATMSQSLE